jgi:hypothetical protein
MPHLIKEFAKNCGVKVGEPILSEHFFPLPCDNYVTIDSNQQHQVSQYRFWKDVVDLLRVCFDENDLDYKIINISNPKAPPIGEDYRLDSLSVKQMNHLIKNSKFHLAVDDATCHIASAYDVPQVVLFSNSKPEYNGPVWGDKFECLLPKYERNKASFLPQEKEPVVNTIFPDVVVKGFCKRMGIQPPNHKVVYVGRLYHHHLNELIPNIMPDSNHNLQGKLVNVRMDIDFNEQVLAAWLERNRCSVITKQKISLSLIERYRNTLMLINFSGTLGNFPEPEYLAEIERYGVKTNLFCHGGDEKLLSQERNKYFDFNLDVYPEIKEFPFEFDPDLKFKTNKVIFCKDGVFGSRCHMNFLDNSNKILDTRLFTKELEHFYIYDDKEKDK